MKPGNAAMSSPHLQVDRACRTVLLLRLVRPPHRSAAHLAPEGGVDRAVPRLGLGAVPAGMCMGGGRLYMCEVSEGGRVLRRIGMAQDHWALT